MTNKEDDFTSLFTAPVDNSDKWSLRCPRPPHERSVISANNDSSVYGRQVAGTRGQIFGQGGQGNDVHDILGRWALLRQIMRG